MSRTNRLTGAALAAALVIAPGALLAQETAPAADAAATTSLENAVRTLTAQVDAQRTETEGLRTQLAAQDAKVADLQAAATAAQARASGLERELAASRATAQELQQALDGAKAEVAAKSEAQHALTEQAESVAATAAAQELHLNETQAALDKQRAELLAARNDLDSAQREIVTKDKQIEALATAGRELVASGESLAGEKQALEAQLAISQAAGETLQQSLTTAKTELMAARNDLASAERAIADRDKQIQALANTGRELVAGGEELAANNMALEGQLAELTGPGQTFLSAVAENLGPDSGVTVVDGRLVLPSDITFAPGASGLSPAAHAKALEFGQAIAAALATLPDDAPWFLRVDGHTDRQRVGGHRFASNRELSAARAMAVTDVLIEAGVPPERVAPAAFGEFHPLEDADTPEAYQANRRIELELDDD